MTIHTASRARTGATAAEYEHAKERVLAFVRHARPPVDGLHIAGRTGIRLPVVSVVLTELEDEGRILNRGEGFAPAYASGRERVQRLRDERAAAGQTRREYYLTDTEAASVRQHIEELRQ